MKPFLTGTKAALLLSLLASPAHAYQFRSGALVDESSSYEDRVSFGPINRFSQQRRAIQIPKAYGRLLSISTENSSTTMWFESIEGQIRNVIIDGSTPVIVIRTGDAQ
ncbi:hypothetical protein [Jeongeupia chitinilytica]|uniref:Uncharacterized protein n=1 Tax=Jeongeupia chitinilytica TaxID=1041641 RepID=A0ABQ3GX70_9NEIS|nr:hypothetical protein [Jeongeupia chitinilytica]GHD59271.1 hypothetical protein GCM10007350_10500 [Jeongeupia chitinilytica]